MDKTSSEDRATSNAALWMLLLLRLTVVTTDDRLELRNSMSLVCAFHSVSNDLKVRFRLY
jgi:hypothetical protein